MGAIAGTINLTPIFNVLLWVVGIGLGLFVLVTVIGSVLDFLTGGENEFGAIVVFWGAVAALVVLVVLAFTHHIVAFE